MELTDQISDNLQQGNDTKVFELTRQALNINIPAKTILDDGFLTGMNIIGKQFKDHEIFLPDVLLAAKAMQAGMELLKPILANAKIEGTGKIVMGTVQGDLHDLGKNLVAIMLKGAGFEVIDLGKDVAPQVFVDTAIEHKADMIGMSALLTTTMSVMKKVCDLLREKDTSGSIKIIVGGAPLSEKIAHDFGADAYAFDAANAVERAKLLCEKI
jgi:5-methyltetrahydrofolate--homocysteine methyltransferase